LIAVGLQEPTDGRLKADDIDGNGKIDVSDATKILRGALGLEVL